MKTKLMHLFLATLAILALGISGASAGVFGKYKVKGTEDFYSFKGTLTLTSPKTCVVRLRYSDGDFVTVQARLETALKDTRKKQTSRFTYSVDGMSGSGSLTVQGIKGGYATNFTYRGYDFRGRGSGTKKP